MLHTVSMLLALAAAPALAGNHEPAATDGPEWTAPIDVDTAPSSPFGGLELAAPMWGLGAMGNGRRRRADGPAGADAIARARRDSAARAGILELDGGGTQVPAPRTPVAAGPTPTSTASGGSQTDSFSFLNPIHLGRLVGAEVTGAVGLRQIIATGLVIGGDNVMAVGTYAPATMFAPNANLSPLFGHLAVNGYPVSISWLNGHGSSAAKMAWGFTPWTGPVPGAGLRAGRSLVIHGGPAETAVAAAGGTATIAYTFKEPGIAGHLVMEDTGANGVLDAITVTSCTVDGVDLFSGAELPAEFFVNDVLNPFIWGWQFDTRSSFQFTVKNNHATDAAGLTSAFVCI